jgi:hypothetical protein
MRGLVLGLVTLLALTLEGAQDRADETLVIRSGGAPVVLRSPVEIVPAPTLELAGAVDANSPAVWPMIDGRPIMAVFTSWGGQPARALGTLSSLGPAVAVDVLPPPGHGVWLESVVPASDGTLYGYYHNEVPATDCAVPTRLTPRLGAARSTDQGRNWTDLGIVLQLPVSTHACASNNYFVVGGVGDASAMLDLEGRYLYLYFSQYGRNVEQQGIGAARMLWADRDHPVGRLDVWSRGVWVPLQGTVLGAPDATPTFPVTKPWHDRDMVVDAFWGPSIHWNEYLETYVMLLNRSANENFSQEGIYTSFNSRLDDPAGWSTPLKILNRGEWYPQVMGLEGGRGTDKLAGAEARLFMAGRSDYLIRFHRGAR